MKNKYVLVHLIWIMMTATCLDIYGVNLTMLDTFICPPCGDGTCDLTIYTKPGTCTVCNMTLMKKSSVKNVAIFIYDGVEVLDFTGPGEVFAVSRSDVGSFNVYTVSISEAPIISQGFIKIIPEYSFENAPKPDIIVLPGGNTGPVLKSEALITWVKDVAPHLDVALSVCTGAFILQKAGLLKGKKATTFHNAIDNLRKIATDTEVLENVRWVDNGDIVTTAGVSAGIDGALHVVEKIFGREMAEATARYMEYDKWNPEEGLIVKR